MTLSTAEKHAQTDALERSGSPRSKPRNPFNSLAIDFLTVAIAKGKAGVYLNPGIEVVGYIDRDDFYYQPSRELLNIDIALLRRAAILSMKGLNSGKPENCFFPVNINNLRRKDMRETLFKDIRQIPKKARAYMCPVFVRFSDGFPTNTLVEQVGYMKGGFPSVRLFTSPQRKLESFPWPPRDCGILLGGLSDEPLDKRPIVLSEWRGAAQLRGLSVAVLAQAYK